MAVTEPSMVRHAHLFGLELEHHFSVGDRPGLITGVYLLLSTPSLLTRDWFYFSSPVGLGSRGHRHLGYDACAALPATKR